MTKPLYRYKLLGVPIYSVYRLSEERRELPIDPKDYEFPGLVSITHDASLEVGFWTQDDFCHIAEKTYYCALMSLLIKGHISMQLVQNEYRTFFGLLKSSDFSFQLTVKNNEAILEDPFSIVIYMAVVFVDRDHPNKKDLSKVASVVFNHYLGMNEEYRRPSRSWLQNMLESYSHQFDWMESIVESKLLGLNTYTHYQLRPVDLQRIEESHSKLEQELDELNKDSFWAGFKKAVTSSVEKDLSKRTPRNDD